MSLYKRDAVTEAFDVELQALNDAVKEAHNKRKAWMDDHMQDYCVFKPGDEIYDLTSGRLLGVVSRLYRFHENHPEYDTSMTVDCEYRTDGKPHGTQGGCFDNTSRQYLHYGTKEDLIRWRESELQYLRKAE